MKGTDNPLKVSDGPFSSTTTVTRYSRQDVLRILHLRAKQLRAWEHAGLVSFSDTYSFQDLVQLRKLRDLRATRLSAASIRASVHAMQAVSGMTNPLLEAAAIKSGSRITLIANAELERVFDHPVKLSAGLHFDPLKQIAALLLREDTIAASIPVF